MARGLWALLAAGLLLAACGPARSVPQSPPVATVKTQVQPALWWAIPTLLPSGVPVYLPSWLPPSDYKGPSPVAPASSFALDPIASQGFPPLAVLPRAEISAAGRLMAVPGYTVGLGYAGQGAGPGPGGKPWPPFEPYLVPTTLTSPYTAALGGRNTPPIYLEATTITGTGLPGRLVNLTGGRHGYLSTFRHQGSLGDWTRVTWKQGNYAYVVGYPAVDNGGEAIALRIAGSLVRVSQPSALKLTFTYQMGGSRHRATLQLTPGGSLTAHPPAPITLAGPPMERGQAFGYRYQISRAS